MLLKPAGTVELQSPCVAIDESRVKRAFWSVVPLAWVWKIVTSRIGAGIARSPVLLYCR